MTDESQTTGDDRPIVRIKTNYGSMVVQLYPDKAPKTVESFLSYVDDEFYDNTLFHRVIASFMIQGGGFERGLYQKGTQAPIQNEANPNGLKNTKYTVAMARTSDPHSATAQFFVNTADNPFLDFTQANEEGWGYCAFGEVIEGVDTAKTISEVETEERMGMSDVPIQDVIIESIRRETDGKAKTDS